MKEKIEQLIEKYEERIEKNRKDLQPFSNRGFILEDLINDLKEAISDKKPLDYYDVTLFVECQEDFIFPAEESKN